ncbi:MAG TPA: NYN domain-containing protein, partial [Sandaracinaceae bacterium]
CYTKQHIDYFVIISGDSDFSPLVSKLRENNKVVIGLGVKNSSSDLLIENCDEFIYYDDLVRARRAAKHGKKKKRPRAEREPERRAAPPPPSREEPRDAPPSGNGEDLEARRQEALDHVLDVVEALFEDRDTHLWGSMVKQTLKRKRPNFSERFHGYRTFSELLEDAEKRGLLELSKDERSGGYIITSFGPNA